jgi:hypothetical protein
MTVTFSPETEAWIAERKRKGDDPETKAWLDERKREALLIDPATAEVDWGFGQTLDPYGTIPTCLRSFSRSAENISPGGLGATFGFTSTTSPTMSARSCGRHPNAKPSFTVKANGQVIWNIDLPAGFEPPF